MYDGLLFFCVFWGGRRKEDGRFVTHGGRVLGVTAGGKDLKKALNKAYKAVSSISWEGVHYRKDIGRRTG